MYYKIFTKYSVVIVAIAVQLNSAPVLAQKFPTCTSHHSDPDGDGYGWEHGTCLVKQSAQSTHDNKLYGAEQTGVCVDTGTLNDGWGWNGHSSCRITNTQETWLQDSAGTQSVAVTDTITAPCIDTGPLNDGWGWDGTKSCQIFNDNGIENNNDNHIDKLQSDHTPFQKHGKLTVCNRENYMLCDQHGQPVQLTGMSSHGIHWSGWHTYDRNGCLTENSLDMLAQSWGTEVFRIAMYVEYGGYLSNPEETIRHVNTIIDELSDRGMYAIVDFHILAGTGVSGNPLHYADTAEQFFRRIVRDNAHRQNVLYEIANEPQASDLTWQQIRQYGDRITRAIRDEEHSDNHAVVIVGTNSWSSFGIAADGTFYDIVNNPVHDSASNLMYAFHFYASDPSHISKGYKEALSEAVHHIPVFVSEWGTQNASGNGKNDFERAREYVQLMREKKIGWTMWNFSDAEESSAVWNDSSFCGRNQDWDKTDNLSATGHFIRDIFKAR